MPRYRSNSFYWGEKLNTEHLLMILPVKVKKSLYEASQKAELSMSRFATDILIKELRKNDGDLDKWANSLV